MIYVYGYITGIVFIYVSALFLFIKMLRNKQSFTNNTGKECKIEFIDGSYRKGNLVSVQLSLFGKPNFFKISDKGNNIHICNSDNIMEIVYFSNDFHLEDM